jgi:hypothetical protein
MDGGKMVHDIVVLEVMDTRVLSFRSPAIRPLSFQQ